MVTLNSQDMKHEPILLAGTDKMILRYAHHKSFKVQLCNTHEWQNGFNPANDKGLVWYTDGSKTNESTGAGVYKRGSKIGHSFSLGLHTMVFQMYMYAIKACIMDNTEGKGRGKAVPLQARTSPQGSRRSRLPDF
jgi:hypothetical protein